MSHHQYWHMDRLPFGSSFSGTDFYLGNSQREALARVQFLTKNARTAGLLIGPAGVGRTSMLRYIGTYVVWADVVETCLFEGSSDDSETLAREFALALGAPPRIADSHSASRFIGDTLDATSRQEVQTLILVDDASPACARLVGSMVNRSKFVTALLACEVADARECAQQLGGCPLRVDLPPWDLDDSATYVRHSVVEAGGNVEIFSDAALVRLHELSAGRVGVLSRLAELSLLAGAGAEVNQISAELVEAIEGEVLVGVA